jgi:hypothetical protein
MHVLLQVCMYLILTAASDSLRHMSPAQIDDAVSSLVEPILHSGQFAVYVRMPVAEADAKMCRSIIE